MASTQIQTSSLGSTIQPGAVARAGSRLWAAVGGGASGGTTGVNLYYSDTDGASWTRFGGAALDASNVSHATVATGLNGATWECHVIVAGWVNDDGQALTHYKIISNVDTGTPGAATSSTIVAGGAHLGYQLAVAFCTPTVTRPRIWAVASHATAAGDLRTVAYYGLMGATPSWAALSTNIGSLNGSPLNGELATGCYWTVAAADKATIVVTDNNASPGRFAAFTFDPTAVTPAIGSATNFGALSTLGFPSDYNEGGLIAICAKADYLVFLRQQRPTGTFDAFKTVNGTSWTQPTGWTALTGGRAAVGGDGTDFWVVHSDTLGTSTSSAQTLRYRKITTSTDTMGGISTFSDTAGNGVAVPALTGTSKLYAVYRGSTASPFTVRSDFVSIGGAADTTAPGTPSLTLTANRAGLRIDISSTMPADTDVAFYKILRRTDQYPTGYSDGSAVVAVAETATSANAVVTFNDTGLTNGTRYYYGVYVKDTSANISNPANAAEVAREPLPAPTLLTSAHGAVGSPPTVGSVNPIFQVQLAAKYFETGKPAGFRVRFGTDNATPPTANTSEFASSTGGDGWYYSTDAGANWTAVPAGGIPTSAFTALLEFRSTLSSNNLYYSMAVEQ